MRKMVLFAVAIAALSATAVQGRTISKTVATGRPLKLGFFSSVNPDCSSRGRPTIRLTRAPEHGRVTVTQTMDFPNFPASNVRFVCNKSRVAGTAINYVSDRGFVGTDNVQAETIFPDGNSTQRSYTIKVIP
jgi:hypothetical protein